MEVPPDASPDTAAGLLLAAFEPFPRRPEPLSPRYLASTKTRILPASQDREQRKRDQASVTHSITYINNI
jgi:hypothetical protein